MLEWLEQNKEWFLSGAGVLVISSVIAVVSSILTLYVKFRSDRKKRKVISINTKLNKYKIENFSKKDDLAVSYNGKPYEDLCQYIIVIENTGPVAVEGQEILVLLPIDCQQLNISTELSSQTIKIKKETYTNGARQEELYAFQRLEPLDNVTISYILNTDATEEINIQPRGTDGIQYNLKGYEHVPELRLLILYTALFLLVGSVPIIGGMLQILVLLLASKTIINVVQEFYENSRKQGHVEIGHINMDRDSSVKIWQK